jgi:hypothetical protein
MNPDLFIRNVLAPSLKLMPGTMDTPAARIVLLAIAYQESALGHRRQVGGPARGYWQFEQGGGVRGVLNHAASKPHIRSVLTALDYDPDSNQATCYAAIEHNDVLAAAFARLLLWTDAEPLPADAVGAWALYLRTWRPGKPHPDKWEVNYQRAKEAVHVFSQG